MTHMSVYRKMRIPHLSHSFHSILRHSQEVTPGTRLFRLRENSFCQRCFSSINENPSLLKRSNVNCSNNKLFVKNDSYCVSLPQRLIHVMSSSSSNSNIPERGYKQQIRGLKGRRDKAGGTVHNLINPIDKLQSYVEKPILAEEDYVFKPTEEDIWEAQKLFLPGIKNKIQFLKSALLEEQLPQYNLPEVAFIGRSNVGKSSLISMLLSHTDVTVKTSSKPGHTKLLNFFQMGQYFTMVDMPGYGFNMPAHYSSSVEQFLSSRSKLCRTFLLIDGTVGITERDVIGLNMLEEFHIPYVMTFLLMDGKAGPTKTDELRFEIIKSLNIDFCIILTKIDKTKPTVLLKSFLSVLSYRNQTSHCFPQPFLVSSINGEGVPVLQSFIAYVTGNLNVKGL